jgi:hypothetical protein
VSVLVAMTDDASPKHVHSHCHCQKAPDLNGVHQLTRPATCSVRVDQNDGVHAQILQIVKDFASGCNAHSPVRWG